MDIDKQKEWEENYQAFKAANTSSTRLCFETDSEKLRFIIHCERAYRKTTQDHLLAFEEKIFEGNVDERRWFRFAKELQENGHIF